MSKVLFVLMSSWFVFIFSSCNEEVCYKCNKNNPTYSPFIPNSMGTFCGPKRHIKETKKSYESDGYRCEECPDDMISCF